MLQGDIHIEGYSEDDSSKVEKTSLLQGSFRVDSYDESDEAHAEKNDLLHGNFEVGGYTIDDSAIQQKSELQNGNIYIEGYTESDIAKMQKSELLQGYIEIEGYNEQDGAPASKSQLLEGQTLTVSKFEKEPDGEDPQTLVEGLEASVTLNPVDTPVKQAIEELEALDPSVKVDIVPSEESEKWIKAMTQNGKKGVGQVVSGASGSFDTQAAIDRAAEIQEQTYHSAVILTDVSKRVDEAVRASREDGVELPSVHVSEQDLLDQIIDDYRETMNLDTTLAKFSMTKEQLLSEIDAKSGVWNREMYRDV